MLMMCPAIRAICPIFSPSSSSWTRWIPRDIKPLAHPLEATQRLRPDTVTETNDRENFQQVAPQTENGLYLVPKVLE